jgi:hypothetical protein
LCISTHHPASASSSSIRRADCTQFFNHQKFKNWLSDSAGILWLYGPRGSGKTLLAKYLKRDLDSRGPVVWVVEYNVQSTESTFSSFCRDFFNQLVGQPHYSPFRDDGLDTLNISDIVEAVRRAPVYSQSRLSQLEMTIFVDSLENSGRHPDKQKEFLLNILKLFRQMETARLFKIARFLLISRWDLGIQATIDRAGVEVNFVRFDSERSGLFFFTPLGCFDGILI